MPRGPLLAAALALAGCADGDALGRGTGTEPPADEPRQAAPQVRMEPEAGFVEVGLGGRATVPVIQRLFYSFYPAESHPEDAPVLVFFNGGPGYATTNALWLYGTGPHVIDPGAVDDDGERPIENEFPYTRFANLLYVDSRGAGFSHALLRAEPLEEPEIPPPDRSVCRGAEAPLFQAAVCAGEDALDFIEVVLEFLDTHRALSNNPVVLVGESYGGNRAVAMLSMLQHHEGTAEDSSLPDYGCAFPWLGERVRAHFELAFPERESWGAEQVAEQFGWQVLIQPGLAKDYQSAEMEQDPDLAPYLPDRQHEADVRVPADAVARIDAQPGRVNANPDSVALLLGMEPRDVQRLTPENGRGDAFRIFHEGASEQAAREAPLRASLGELTEHDAYWLTRGDGISCDWDVGRSVFYEMVGRTRTFVTNARYDAVVWGDAIRAKIQAERDAEHDTTHPEGTARPGIIRFAADDGSPVEIRFPEYDAGHVVTMSTPRELGEDIEAWLRATGAIR